MSEAHLDVGIIGGGPAGSAIAAYLAKAGLKCAIFEREIHPRPHVGESLVPSTTRVLKDIGFIERMDAEGFVRKFGAVWTSSAANPHLYADTFEDLEPKWWADIRFVERKQEGVDRFHTWHVDRGKFDLLLLQHAEKLGAQVYEGVRVSGVDFSVSESPSIQFFVGRKQMSVSAGVVVDASGRQTLLGNQLKLKKIDPVFNQYALHSWFDGYDRKILAKEKEFENYIFIHFLPITNSWIWQIPITGTITSIGVVTQKKNFEKSRESREKFFWNCLSSRPELVEALRGSEQMRALREEGDYSYGMTQICGDGFVMVGDAARFVDPIFSSGVSIAFTSAKLASDAIIKTAHDGRVFKKESFKEFEDTMRRGTKNWYDFISLYYRLNILFTAFIQNPRYRLDVLKLLQGDLYDEAEPPVLQEMRRVVTDVEKRKNYPWHKLLGDLTGELFKPAF